MTAPAPDAAARTSYPVVPAPRRTSATVTNTTASRPASALTANRVATAGRAERVSSTRAAAEMSTLSRCRSAAVRRGVVGSAGGPASTAATAISPHAATMTTLCPNVASSSPARAGPATNAADSTAAVTALAAASRSTGITARVAATRPG